MIVSVGNHGYFRRMSEVSPTTRLDRRSALKFFATGAAGAAVPTSVPSARAEDAPVKPQVVDPASAVPRGTSTDPNLVQPNNCPWPKILTDPELKTISVLADIILPADDLSPSASQAGVPDFINEWVSAPFEKQIADLQTIRSGLAWLNTESFKRNEKSFVELDQAAQLGICDEICSTETAKPELMIGATFFIAFKGLCLSGFYSSEAGFKDLGYKGNVPMPTFPGPPPEVLKHLGLV